MFLYVLYITVYIEYDSNKYMGVNGSKIDFKDPHVEYTTRGMDDPDGVGRVVIFREQGYDMGYDVQPTTPLDVRTRGEKGPLRAVQLFSKSKFQGETFEIEYGNYPSDVFIPAILPSNVFSLTVPPRTTIKLFSGDEYDFGGKGGMSLTNASEDVMRVEHLPSSIRGQIRSISIISHSIDRAGRISDPDSDESDAVITTERGDVIAAGMMVERSGDRDIGELNIDTSGVEPFHNMSQVRLYPEMVVVFYLFLIVVVVFLMYENKPTRQTLTS
jgi:hypothetical protein